MSNNDLKLQRRVLVYGKEDAPFVELCTACGNLLPVTDYKAF